MSYYLLFNYISCLIICPFSSSNTFLFFFIFVVFYCIVTISVFCYIFFVLFCLVITLFNFYNLLLNFSQQKVGSWEDRQYCLYETTVDRIAKIICGPYIYIYIICLWLFTEIYTYLLTYIIAQLFIKILKWFSFKCKYSCYNHTYIYSSSLPKLYFIGILQIVSKYPKI